jgi:hypothetical protein
VRNETPTWKEAFVQPKPSLATNLKSSPWFPYSASTMCESLTASNFSGTTPLTVIEATKEKESLLAAACDARLERSTEGGRRGTRRTIDESDCHQVDPSVREPARLLDEAVSLEPDPSHHLMRRPSEGEV